MQLWQDDLSQLTCRRADSVLELTLRDALSEGTLPQLTYLPRGPERCVLGVNRKELLAAWNIREPVMANGALVLGTPESSPYDAILVWFKDDKAVRIVARHRSNGRLADAAQASLAMRQDWAKQLGEFGWPWRHDFAGGNVLQSWGHHDDRTRVRIFWQDSASGKQIFTEWMHVS
jgi:hypothetical protein